jgi:hypothetical protein
MEKFYCPKCDKIFEADGKKGKSGKVLFLDIVLS